jgi:hypothetical protein
MITSTRTVNRHPEAFHKGTYKETLFPFAECMKYDDFLGKLDVTTFWTVQDTAGGAETKDATGLPGGWLSLALTNVNEAQTAGLDCADVLDWNIDYGLQFECRAQALVLPTQIAELWFGVANANIETTIAAGGPTIHAFFVMDGNGLVCCHTDDNTTSSGLISTGVTLIAGQSACFRIDFTDPASVKFYINGVRVCTTTTFDVSAGTDVLVQPLMQILKAAADTGVGTLLVDYVRIWQERY